MINFQQGGLGMYPTAVAGLVVLGAAVCYGLSNNKRWLRVVLSSAVLTLICGSLGFVMGVIRSIQVGTQFPTDQHYLIVQGIGESLHNLSLAFTCLGIASIFVMLKTLRSASPA